MPSTVYSAGSFPSRSMRLRMSMNFSPRRAAIRRSRRSKASMRAFLPVKYGSLRASSRGSGLWIKTCVAGDSAAMRSSRRSYCRSSASGAMVENIRSLTPAMRNIARGRPATMLSSRAAMPGNAVPAYAAVNHVRFGEVFGPGAPLGEAVAEHHRVVRPHGERLLLTAFREVVVAAVVERVGLSSERDRRGRSTEGSESVVS